MAEINKIKPKTPIEIVNEIRDGTQIEYVVIDGNRVGILGSVSEEDREMAIATLTKAYEQSGGNITKMISVLNTAAMCTENGIKPDAEIEIEIDDDMVLRAIISYSEMKIYDYDGEVLADCEDLRDENGSLPMLPNSVVETLLTDRVKLKIANMYQQDTDDCEDENECKVETCIIY